MRAVQDQLKYEETRVYISQIIRLHIYLAKQEAEVLRMSRSVAMGMERNKESRHFYREYLPRMVIGGKVDNAGDKMEKTLLRVT